MATPRLPELLKRLPGLLKLLAFCAAGLRVMLLLTVLLLNVRLL